MLELVSEREKFSTLRYSEVSLTDFNEAKLYKIAVLNIYLFYHFILCVSMKHRPAEHTLQC